MEKDAALVNRDFVGGKIMWLPEKAMIDASDMPDLDDELFDHPVLIISEHPKERTEIVRVLIITTFGGEGLNKRFGQSLQSRFFLALPPAPAHPCPTRRVSLTFVEGGGYGNTLDRSWINTRKAHSVSYRCLKNWKNWYRTPILTKKSLEYVINYHTNDIPKLERWEEEKRREEEESEKEMETKLSQPLWPRLQHPGTETHGGIVQSDSRAVTATANVLRMSVSMSAKMMIPNSRPHTPEVEEERMSEKSRFSWGGSSRRSGSSVSRRTRELLDREFWRKPQPPKQSGTQVPGDNVQGRSRAATTISDDPPKSKSMFSAMIPGPGSHIHKVEKDGKKEKENERSKQSRALEAQPLQQQPGTEIPGEDVQATTSETWPLMDLSTTLCQKPLVLVSVPPEVLAMTRFDVLSRHIGMCDALASGDPGASVGTDSAMVSASSVHRHLPTAPPGMTIEDLYDVLDTLGHPIPRQPQRTHLTSRW